MIPRATYRIQFHKDFGFERATGLADYLADLGISHLYASPIATARAGSTHGYDVVDPTRINPELGGEEGFKVMAAALRDRGIGIILDIVPNHLAVGGSDNAWWMDVLEKGETSAFARYFDIDWHPSDPALDGKLLAPFLGHPYGEALTSDALELTEDGSAIIAHGTHRFPIRQEDRAGARHEDLHALLERQHYRLAWWRTAADEINWRRFFDITELAGVRVEDLEVFDAMHALPLRLFREGLIDGVRVDHVDGLADPATYLRRLRSALCAGRSEPGYLVVEKILAPDEHLPKCWGTDGTSGYDFMNEVSALLHDPCGEASLTRLWRERTGRPAGFDEEELHARAEILERSFPGQLAAAILSFHRIARSDARTRDITEGMISRSLQNLLMRLNGYRTYAGTPQDGRDRLDRAAILARQSAAPGEEPVIGLLVDWIMNARKSPLHSDAARRFEQLSAPLAAKAVEDTAFYRYGRLLSRTDVGFDPARVSQSSSTFLKRIAGRSQDFPCAMLATATHDHKRGEDVRARLAVLSEIPDMWEAFVDHMESSRFGVDVDPGDRLMILQTIVGAFPYDRSEFTQFADRVIGWSHKAVREAKLRSSWTLPNKTYEASCASYISNLLSDEATRSIIDAFVDQIGAPGAINALTQTLLKYTLPGVPDCYQGCDLWDLSLVDPDNRRPVDFAARQPVMSWADHSDLAHTWKDGRIKQALIARLMALRIEAPDVFVAPVEPLPVRGIRSEHVVAFRRRGQTASLFVIAPLRCASGVPENDKLGLAPDWLAAIELDQGAGLAAPEWTSAQTLLGAIPLAFFLKRH